MPPPGPRWVIWGQLRPYSETEGASSTPRSRPYPTPSPPDSRSDPARSELHCALRAHDQSAALPFWQRGSTGSARQRIGVREARTRLASSPPSAAAGSAARNGCRAHSTAVAPAGLFERPSAISLGGLCGGFTDVVTSVQRSASVARLPAGMEHCGKSGKLLLAPNEPLRPSHTRNTSTRMLVAVP